jgi:hypothetical protein
MIHIFGRKKAAFGKSSHVFPVRVFRKLSFSSKKAPPRKNRFWKSALEIFLMIET